MCIYMYILGTPVEDRDNFGDSVFFFLYVVPGIKLGSSGLTESTFTNDCDQSCWPQNRCFGNLWKPIRLYFHIFDHSINYPLPIQYSFVQNTKNVQNLPPDTQNITISSLE